ncbi:glycosyltransferase family 2 protein [Frankia sp. R43]|uniref:glycosyltransferase family 2 protein n=1 Tax=Frankia sp. R43 TaxID=269536 RepID=UPI0009FB749F|nr:glycosyltransferase family 2 protein [Frankia sp. R43]
MNVVAVIVHWGRVEPTVELARQLDEISLVSRVIVVANDGKPRPQSFLPGSMWLTPDSNRGFGGGFMAGYEEAPDADIYLLLNNDVRLTGSTVRECLDVFADPRVGIVGPTQLNADGIHTGCGRMTPVASIPRKRRVPSTEIDDVDWINGAIMFVRGDCLRRVPMPVKYFLGYEDTDYCYRARAAGWRVVVSPAQAWHSGGGTLPSAGFSYYLARNRLWFARSHRNASTVALTGAWLALAVAPRVALKETVSRRSFEHSRMIVHGIRDGLATQPRSDELMSNEPRPRLWGAWASAGT